MHNICTSVACVFGYFIICYLFKNLAIIITREFAWFFKNI